jgi:hypothetical protein
MLAFSGMLVPAAEKVGMKVPVDTDEFDPVEFPHFAVFCNVQLARPVVYHGEHWDNAGVVAKIPDDQIMSVTLIDLLNLGLSYAQ